MPSTEPWFPCPFGRAYNNLESSRQLTSSELEWANEVYYEGTLLQSIAKTLNCHFRYRHPMHQLNVVMAPLVLP